MSTLLQMIGVRRVIKVREMFAGKGWDPDESAITRTQLFLLIYDLLSIWTQLRPRQQGMPRLPHENSFIRFYDNGSCYLYFGLVVWVRKTGQADIFLSHWTFCRSVFATWKLVTCTYALSVGIFLESIVKVSWDKGNMTTWTMAYFFESCRQVKLTYLCPGWVRWSNEVCDVSAIKVPCLWGRFWSENGSKFLLETVFDTWKFNMFLSL